MLDFWEHDKVGMGRTGTVVGFHQMNGCPLVDNGTLVVRPEQIRAIRKPMDDEVQIKRYQKPPISKAVNWIWGESPHETGNIIGTWEEAIQRNTRAEALLDELNGLHVVTIGDALHKVEIRRQIVKLGFSTNKRDNTYVLAPLADNRCIVCGGPRNLSVDTVLQEKCYDCYHAEKEQAHHSLRAFFAAISKIASTTYYTVVEDTEKPIKQAHPFYTLISTPGARTLGKRPSMYGYFADPGEASQETQISYGRDSEYVTPEVFRGIHP